MSRSLKAWRFPLDTQDINLSKDFGKFLNVESNARRDKITLAAIVFCLNTIGYDTRESRCLTITFGYAIMILSL
jgi:hypothetical protein